jgi:ABC-2 type transport system ATP-binding protein
MDAISVTQLRKTFGRTVALDSLDLHVTRGEVHGFLGPNGAGKSTTLRILLGILRADSGTARTEGRTAYVPGDVSLWPTLSGGEAIDLLGRLHGTHDEDRRRELVERFELDETTRCGAYSKGNRQKVALVSAFSCRAELLLLDEPTSGLDPLMEAVFQRTVAEVNAQGVTVLLSSHILSEVEALCDRVSIVRAGRVVETGTLTELRHLTRTRVVAHVEGTPPDLAGLEGVHDLVQDNGDLTFTVDEGSVGGVLRALARSDVRTFTSEPPTLEELFLRHYESVPS